MRLKGRLKMIADMVGPCEVACDVGTDHAYIPVYLIEKDICKKALAMDIRKGPIDIAEGNVKKYKLADRIETRIGYGLQPLKQNEADVIIIAGMGGQLIAEILAEAAEKARKAGKLVLQPMNAPEVLREWLYGNGFDISDENLVEDTGKIYCVISAKWVSKAQNKDNLLYHVGEKLIEKKDPLLHKYLSKRIAQLEKEIAGLQRAVNTEEELAWKLDLKEKMQSVYVRLYGGFYD